MKRLPPLHHQPAPAWQTQRLARWWQEWSVHCRLREDEPEEPTPGVLSYRLTGSRMRFDTTDRDRPVQAGQIRLLHPTTSATRRRLLYVAVISEQIAGGYLIAPFGRFAEPALPGEWLTGRTEPALRVMCLWNARSVPRRTVEDSWLIDELSPEERGVAGRALEPRRRAAASAAAQAQQVGPPIVHPLDPRWDYIEDERDLMDAIAASGLSFPTADETAEIALAAEARAPYGGPSKLYVAETTLALRIAQHADPALRSVMVVDEAERPSKQLDGAVLQDAAGNKSAPIADAQVTVPSSLATDQAVLVTADGRRLPLRASR